MLSRMTPTWGLARSLAIVRTLSTASPTSKEPPKKKNESLKMKPPTKMSLAMKYYMEKRRKQDEFIMHERSEFEMGKKHLANMMGMESNAMTQTDIDTAIEYLFPSGLYEPKARPMMKPPEEVFPREKEAEFDLDGRPFHPFFYCVTSQFVKIMYDVTDQISSVTFFAERMQRQNRPPDPEQALDEITMAGTRWMTYVELKERLAEDIKEKDYDDFLNAFDRLLENPFAYKAKDFIFKYRLPVATSGITSSDVLQPEYDSEGRAFVEAMGQRKTSVARVKVIKPGTGRFTIHHVDHMEVENDIIYFHSFMNRHEVMYPLQFTRLLGLVDVECVVDAGGCRGQAGAIRYALSVCLKSFVDSQTVEEMQVCGLLTQDIRYRERKKPGQEGARRKFTWKRR